MNQKQLGILLALTVGVLASACDSGSSGGNLNPGIALPNGPVACNFETFAYAGSTVTWTTEPSGNTAGAHIEGAPWTSAGFACQLSKPLADYDLSGYDTLEFDGSVPVGVNFDVGVGHYVNSVWYGCSWHVVGNDTATYDVDLTTPDWCGPTQCGYDLQADQVVFTAAYGIDNTTIADIAVSRIQFLTKKAAAHSIALPGSGKGPGGACWFTSTNGGGSAQWYAPLTSQSAKVHVVAPDDNGVSNGQMNMELGDIDLSNATLVTFVANVPSGEIFSAGLSDNSSNPGASGCWWDFAGKGRDTYSFDPKTPTGRWGAGTMDLTQIHQITFTGCCGRTVDMEVNSVTIVAP